MPELPEVEVVRAGLAEHVTGRVIDGVDVYGARVIRRHLPGPADFRERLLGRVITGVQRRGKYLWLLASAAPEHLSEGEGVDDPVALVTHLGMSGQMLIASPDQSDHKHLRARLRFADAGVQLRFVDQRTFGSLAVEELVDGVPASITHIARDPFDPEFDDQAIVSTIRRRNSAIKRVLLDQRIVSGIGNIYADEALWRARINGERLASSLRPSQIRAVLDSARDVMGQALAQGGTSFDKLYVNVNGASGYFDRSLNAYGQRGRECARCGTGITRVAFANRSSYFCPRCQPRPRQRTSARLPDAADV